MKECHVITKISKENQHSLQRLLRAIALSKGQFALILVRCNYEQLREQILLELRGLSKDINLRELVLSPTTIALHTTILKELFEDNPNMMMNSQPSAVMVFGLESVINLENQIINVNQVRDIYAENFQFPLVFWLKDQVATLLARVAPDFKSWAATTIRFEMEPEGLVAMIRHEVELLFTKVLEEGAERFLSNASLTLDHKSCQYWEIELARNDLLRLYGIKLEPELEACIEFVLGRNRHVKGQIDDALFHYQRSLDFWQQQVKTSSAYFLREAVVLFHIGLGYREMADLRPAFNKDYWQKALFFFRTCLEVLEAARRKDLVAKFILAACEMLQCLQAWEDLQTLAQESLDLHKIYGTKAQIAQDYGFLATVAASNCDWLEADKLANAALAIAEDTPEVSRQQEAWYLLLLGRAQRYLGDSEEAINRLEWAKVVCEPQYDPCLYIDILEELRSLYFSEHRDYLEAFNLKQEKIQIEHQYGFRAFIGASQLQPQRHRINPICGLQISSCSLEVAQEIINSGRQQDLNRLIERISRADCKLTVIHGPSGVGKSSTLKAGLVPALKQKVIGDRLPLTVFLSIYTDWLTGIFCSLNQAIAQTDISLISEISSSKILEKLRLLSERNYTIILIFDQVEEFFFVNTDIDIRIEFYKLLSACLNIPFVKIILSLREDYLHYLLEFERLSNDKIEHTYDIGVINKNILDKDIRYYLGKFSIQDSIEIIHNLTQRSHYKAENELITQLVQDLAGELNEVHPIELQIVGAQLQVEKITTLEEYKICGGSQKLVKRWLEEVIQDCGEENQQLGWKLLFALTDEKGTRPLKTKAELVEGESLSSYTLDMILEIIVGSGLVVRVLEESGERYQLVHDYLVEPIRQKNNYCIVAEFKKVQIEKKRAEVAQKLSQEQLYLVLQRRLREARLTGIVLATMVATIGALWWQANVQKQAAVLQTIRAERSETNLKISGLTAASEALFASNKEFDALLESLRAFRLLKQTNTVQPETRMRVVTALQQAVYGVTEINRLEGHHDIVWGVSFSPDNRLLASGSTDRTVKVWLCDGTLLQTLNGHRDAVTSVSFSPDGLTIASASLDKTVRLWHRNSIKAEFDPLPYKTLEGDGDWVYSVNFSPDGQLLASGGKDGRVRLWSSNGKPLKVLRGHTGWVNWVNFSPNSQFIASASEDQTVKIWRRDGRLVQTLLGHSSGVTYVAFSPDGQTLATGSRDKTVKLWRWEPKSSKNGFVFRLVRTLPHTGTVWSLSFSSNGRNLATAGDDKRISLWNITETNSLENRPYRIFKGHNDAIASVAFSPDNKLLASGSYDKSVKLWRLESPKLPILKGHQDRVLSVAWSPDGKMLVSGSRDRTVKLWQRYSNASGVETTLLYKTLVGHTDRVASVSFDPLEKMFVSGSYDKTIKLWRRDGLLLKTLSGHSGSVMSVSFSPDGQLLASASKDKTVKLWNRQGKLLRTLSGHQGWVNSVSFTPNSQLLASASDDQTVKLWRRDGTLLKTFSPHESWVLGVSFSPTDKLLASASWDNTVKLWRWDGTLLKTLLKGYGDSVNAVNFSPNGEVLAAASWDSTVKLWSTDGKLIKTLNGHHAPVLSVSFSPDGQTLASASDDKTIILWNLDLHNLLSRGCNWVRDYLKSNRNVDQRDRSLCD